MLVSEHTPQINCQERYTITSDSLNEILDYCIPRIRVRSQDYYKKEITKDINESCNSWIDNHAGQGVTYIIKLI